MVAAATQIIQLPLQYCGSSGQRSLFVLDVVEVEEWEVLELLRRNRDMMMMFNEVDEGKIPKDSLTLQMLYEEMIRWPNLELSIITLFQSLYPNPYIISYISDKVEVSKKQPRDSNVEWDSAAAIEEADVDDDDTGVASKAMGYGALYLVSSFPVIIGISVVLILFYNSLQ
ncbi:unnamed protein product [Brassica napus]|uniref:(rape) hypothetical protein n=1 Tax=Brassica napus TaxID=3708 RepID=A0A816X608_BRANA|nr:unnamed protein product [Brassica napus]